MWNNHQAHETASGMHATAGLHPTFYKSVYNLVLNHRHPFQHAYSVTRRDMAFADYKSLDEILNTKGYNHLGHDTMIFPYSYLPYINLGGLVLGYSPFGCFFLRVGGNVLAAGSSPLTLPCSIMYL
eukprot:scaffold1762_cov383-Prasinococcus_capsulatus_cf.AAC.12